jgi:hypothetical protein
MKAWRAIGVVESDNPVLGLIAVFLILVFSLRHR